MLHCFVLNRMRGNAVAVDSRSRFPGGSSLCSQGRFLLKRLAGAMVLCSSLCTVASKVHVLCSSLCMVLSLSISPGWRDVHPPLISLSNCSGAEIVLATPSNPDEARVDFGGPCLEALDPETIEQGLLVLHLGCSSLAGSAGPLLI